MNFSFIIKILIFVYSNTQSSSILNLTLAIVLLAILYQSFFFFKSLRTFTDITDSIRKLKEKANEIPRNGNRKQRKLKFFSKVKNSPNLMNLKK